MFLDNECIGNISEITAQFTTADDKVNALALIDKVLRTVGYEMQADNNGDIWPVKL